MPEPVPVLRLKPAGTGTVTVVHRGRERDRYVCETKDPEYGAVRVHRVEEPRPVGTQSNPRIPAHASNTTSRRPEPRTLAAPPMANLRAMRWFSGTVPQFGVPGSVKFVPYAPPEGPGPHKG